MRKNIRCENDISCHYFGPVVCVHCGAEEDLNDSDENMYPMCLTCIGAKKVCVMKLGKKIQGQLLHLNLNLNHLNKC